FGNVHGSILSRFGASGNPGTVQYDAYAVFHKMLKSGNPPDSWDDLWEAASSEGEHIKALLGSNASP
ncbi:type II toxin-antitoxin system YhaV family toxin, partial [Chromohalobacter israelensis]|uniref:type II toxin-antitoxin system YhaV family toxin n=1 Tax=Chromohalobacter israelensis TaxID=141390 RepID=UPI00196A9483